MGITDIQKETLQKGADIMNYSLIKIGDFSLSLFSLLYIVVLIGALYFVSNIIRKTLLKRLEARRLQGINVNALVLILHYVILFFGSLIILQSAGLDLSALTVLAGAIGIGLGFGLQNITSNFISGIIILFERPIKIGDRVETGETMGQVMSIGFRSTTILTNDNISIIVPNSDFVSNKVTNWSHTDDIVRLRIPIGVSYNSDPKKVVEVLENAIEDLPGVFSERGLDVILDNFGNSSINFIVRVWTKDFSKRPGAMRHLINMAIWDALKKEKIEIPFPQLDLHMKELK